MRSIRAQEIISMLITIFLFSSFRGRHYRRVQILSFRPKKQTGKSCLLFCWDDWYRTRDDDFGFSCKMRSIRAQEIISMLSTIFLFSSFRGRHYRRVQILSFRPNLALGSNSRSLFLRFLRRKF